MSTPIDLTERTTILTILDILDALEIVRIDSRGILCWTESNAERNQTASQLIDAYLAALTDAQLARVRVLIVRWGQVEFGMGVMQQGQVAGMNGVSMSMDAEREQCRKYMQQVVPFVRVTDDMRQAKRGMCSTRVVM